MLIHLCLSATDAPVTTPEGNNFILLSKDKFCLLVLARFWSEPYFSLSLAPVCSPTPTLASHLISESVCRLPPVSPGYETTWVAWLTFPFGFAVAAVFQLFHPVVPLLFSSLPRWALFSSASKQREQHHGDHFLCKNSSKLVYIERRKRAHLMLSPGVVVNKYLLHQCLDTMRPCLSTVKTRGQRQIWTTLWMTLAPVPWTVWEPSSASLQGCRSMSWPSLLQTSWAAPSLVSRFPQSISSSPLGADPAVVLCIYNQEAWSFMLMLILSLPPPAVCALCEPRESRRCMLTMAGAEPNSDLFSPHLDVSPCVPAGGMWWRMDSESKYWCQMVKTRL